MHAVLLNLPIETLYIIVKFASDDSILALRASCRHLLDITGHTYRCRFLLLRRVAVEEKMFGGIDGAIALKGFSDDSKNDELQTMEFLPTYTPVIRDDFLYWLTLDVTSQYVVQFLRKFRNISTIELRNSDFHRGADEKRKMDRCLLDQAIFHCLLAAIQELPNITTFRSSAVSENIGIGGVYLSSEIIQKWPTLPHISHLDITIPDNPDGAALGAMSRHFPGLTHLCLRASELVNLPGVNAIAKFSNIRQIELECLSLELPAIYRLFKAAGKQLDSIIFRNVQLDHNNGWAAVLKEALLWLSCCRLTLLECADAVDDSWHEFSGSVLIEDQRSVDVYALLNKFAT